MDYTDVSYEPSESIATITINRPERLNTFRGRTIEELIHAFKRAWADRGVACVILTGAGQKAFCVGGDQKEMQEKGSYGASENGLWEIDELHNVIRDIPKPVIAAVNGFAIGRRPRPACPVRRHGCRGARQVRPGRAARGIVRCRLGLGLPRAYRRREARPGDLVLLPAAQRADGIGVGSRQPRCARRAPDGGGPRPRQASRGSEPHGAEVPEARVQRRFRRTSSVRRRWRRTALRRSSTARRQSRRAAPSSRSARPIFRGSADGRRRKPGSVPGRETLMNRAMRAARFAGTACVGERDIDAPALEAHLRRSLDGFRGPLGVRQFRGGQSNPTYLLETPDRRYVLRRRPAGVPEHAGHAVDREHRVLSALQGSGVPVPAALHLCTDRAVIRQLLLRHELRGRPPVLGPQPAGPRPRRARRHIRRHECHARAAAYTRSRAPGPCRLWTAAGVHGPASSALDARLSREGHRARSGDGRPGGMASRSSAGRPGGPDPRGLPARQYHPASNRAAHPRRSRLGAFHAGPPHRRLGGPLPGLAPHGPARSPASPGRIYRGSASPTRTPTSAPTSSAPAASVEDFAPFLAFAAFRLAAILIGVAKRGEQGTATNDAARDFGRAAREVADLGAHFIRRRSACFDCWFPGCHGRACPDHRAIRQLRR